MNAPSVVEATSAGVSAEWYQAAAANRLGLLLLGALFNAEVVAAVQTWDASTAYNHCFLVIPIALYLVWDRRQDIAGIPPRTDARARCCWACLWPPCG